MPLEVETNVRDGILRARARGQRTAANLKAMWQHVAAACREHDARGVLLLSQLEGAMQAGDMFDVAKNWRDFGLPPALPIALVHLEPVSFDSSVFGTEVARNRGMQVELFGSAEEAERWLAERVTGT